MLPGAAVEVDAFETHAQIEDLAETLLRGLQRGHVVSELVGKNCRQLLLVLFLYGNSPQDFHVRRVLLDLQNLRKSVRRSPLDLLTVSVLQVFFDFNAVRVNYIIGLGSELSGHFDLGFGGAVETGVLEISQVGQKGLNRVGFNGVEGLDPR